ncbi:glycosyltransferase family 4 protein [Granulosicoccus sp. 3-233]|uniref:glycosyltransferase family 4 protein n=1 Tax=Granulosicoccus sp. 3-233 TaxID=3417969 RepID=UPI003D346C98
MHLLYVCADQGIPVFGCKGASVHVQEMVRAFLAQGIRVTIMSPRLEGTPPRDLAHLACIPLPRHENRNATRRARLTMESNELISRALSGPAPCDLVYERHSLFTHAPMSVALRKGIPGVLEVNAPLIEEQSRHRQLPLALEARSMASRAMRCAKVVTAVSPAVSEYARSLGAQPDRIHVVENGVNPRRFPETRKPAGPFTIGFLGTLKPWHDVTTLVQAFLLLRQRGLDASLLIVGDGPERSSLEAQVGRLQLADCVEFTGKQTPSEVPRQLARMHVAVAPYRGDQPFYFSPLKIHEYMAAGLPVVASRVGHLESVIRDEHNGLLCPPGDPLALASKLEHLASDTELARRLGVTAREHVITHHDWNQVASHVLRLANPDRRLTVAS